VSSQVTGVSPDGGAAGEFGANEWLVDEMYEQFKTDKNSVDPSWWPILEKYHQSALADAPPPASGSEPAPSPTAHREAETAKAHRG